MKRNILAVVIPALLAAGAANAAEVYNKDGNKLDLYGKVDGLHYFSKNDSADGDKSYARLGFKGETQITDQLTGYGQWEYQFNANNSEGADATNGDKTRLGFAGVRFGDYGSLDYGRNFGVMYDVGAWVDVLPEFGGDNTYTDNFMSGRATGVLTYRNDNFFGLVDGLHFAAQYQGKNERANDTKRANGDGYGFAMSYDLGWNVSVGGAYSKADRTDAQTLDSKGKNVEAWNAGLKYNDSKVYLAAVYSEARNMTYVGSFEGFANKARTLDLVAQYQFDWGLRPSVAYVQSKGQGLNTVYGDNAIMKYVDVGATYFFNKNMSAYVDYKINLLNADEFAADNGINTNDVVGVGLVYQF